MPVKKYFSGRFFPVFTIAFLLGVLLAAGISVFATSLGTNVSVDGTLTVGSTVTVGGVTYSWPSSDGTSGQFLSTNGSATLSWTTASPASGGGWTDDGTAVRLTGVNDQVSLGSATAISPAVLSVYATTSAASAGIFRAAASPAVNILAVQNSGGTNLFTISATSSLVLSEGLLHVGTTTGTSTFANNLQVGGTLRVGTDSAYLTASALNFSAASSLTTSAGAFTITPAAGSGLNVNLSTTGDFVVTTNDLVVDTSADRVGIQTATPNTTLEVVGTASTTNLVIGGGASISRHLSSAASVNIGVISGNGCAEATMTVTDAADGDTVALGIPNAVFSGTTGSTTFSVIGFVSSAGTVTVRVCQHSATAADPAAATIRADVWKH